MVFKFFFTFLAVLIFSLSARPLSVFEWLKSNYLIKRTPIFYFDDYMLSTGASYGYLCQQDAAGHYSLVLEDDSFVDVIFFQRDTASFKRKYSDRFQTSRSNADKQGSLAYHQALQASMTGFGSSEFLSTPQFQAPPVPPSPSRMDSLNSDSFDQNSESIFFETIPYRPFTSYNTNNDHNIDILKSFPSVGKVFVRDNQLHLVDGGLLDVIFQLRER